jgi:hypothetical protein
VLEKAIGRWRLFREIEPGHRFQTRYNNHSQRRQEGVTSRYGRILNLAAGPALIAAGLAFIPTPGPSYIIIVLGMWMLAGEFLVLARFFDRLEVGLRKLGWWVRDRCNTRPTSVKVLVALLCVATLGYGIYRLVSGG